MQSPLEVGEETDMRPVQPVLVAHLFPDVYAALLDLLGGLTDAEWAAPTVCAGWSVHDVALHLWGGDVGNLSRRRDAHNDPVATVGVDFSRRDELLAFINRFNNGWVEATRRVSPRVLCDSLRLTGPQIAAYFAGLDASAIGAPVSWAGPDPAPVWLDIAREYTERWLHQQQIRDVVGKPGLKEPRFFSPLLDTFVRALPHALRHVEAPEGTSVHLAITGNAGGEWFAARAGQRWLLAAEADTPPIATVTMDQETAWRLFTKGLTREDALPRITRDGDPKVTDAMLGMVSIIA